MKRTVITTIVLPATFKALLSEMKTARRQFPSNEHLIKNLIEFADELHWMVTRHDERDLFDRRAGTVAHELYSKAIQVATLALRIAEEGDASISYGDYLQPSPRQVVMKEETEKTADPCPDCGAPLIAKNAGGVACSKCAYWFCY